ncbi:hypothetical protein, partial [Enterococcus sp. HMSC076E04]|uniref:hypothetical protein n=1 Tax=Enterococcus sp. HMSC076E04 TaxID=1739465 RepID=UPI0008D0436F
MRNYFAVCFSNTQVKTLISQPLNKRCSKACICGNKPNQTKIGGAIFVWLDLLLDAGQLFHNH